MAAPEDSGKDSVFDADATLSAVEDVAIRAAWTPGPWRACDPSDNPHSQTVTADAVECDVCDVLGCATMEANARLIAAAPDLYHALVELLSASLTETLLKESAGRRALARDQARAALAKAVPGTDARTSGTGLKTDESKTSGTSHE